MQIKDRKTENNDWGSIGIGAMIVFIALILVAAVASAVIIQTGEKLQQNAQQTGDDTQQEIGGKISIITAWVGDQTNCDGDGANGDHCLTLVFELAPGSDPILESEVSWSIICDDAAVAPSMQTMFGVFNDANVNQDVTDVVGTQNLAGDGTLDPGVVYMVSLKTIEDANDGNTYTNNGEDCDATINEQHTLIISVDSGGSTYETLSYVSVSEGDTVI
tara:strand:+ start:1038 stop:1691 length:654 start_codon:yes stop_codon:yes gene_type:complete